MTLYCGVCGKEIQPTIDHTYPLRPCNCSKPWPIEMTFHISSVNLTSTLIDGLADLIPIREPKRSKTEIPPTIYDAFSDSELAL